mmetsp:Transcript_27967/g.56630  ORF Transcript_27967/g.56630 Transcript_27967/m.56630 type:complete len:459 (+) Transcript_27967:1-1377(+)
MFAPNDTEGIIGGPTDPTALTMDALNKDPAPGIKTATTNYLSVFANLFYNGAPLDMMNEFYACEAFLKPFGICSMWAHMAPDAEAVEKIKSANPDLESATFQVPRADRPRAMVMDGTLLGPQGYGSGPENEVSLQMSPDYIGSPFYPDDGYLSFAPTIGNGPNLTRLVGGGLVEAFAFGGAPSKEDQNGGAQVRVGAPGWPFSLAQAMGISSMAPAATLGNIPGVGELLDPKYPYWPVTDADHPSAHGSLITKVSDGGNEENSGMLALLQRGVKRVVWFAGSYKLVNRSYNLCDAPTDDDTLIKAGIVDQVLDKFGYGPELTAGSSHGGASNALLHNQVFKRERVHDLACQLQQHLTDGTPPVLRLTEEVQPNSWWGLVGGNTVDIVLVYLEHSANFEALLPPGTRKQLKKGKKGAFNKYPAYPTTLGGGTNAEYNLLAATSEYFVRQNEALFREILG